MCGFEVVVSFVMVCPPLEVGAAPCGLDGEALAGGAGGGCTAGG